ncbi:uncharacterized protein [Parasteatoda tepidariorum]|uniref:uncharacterized protein n=1 Tax=Parasteatoda tepidariorum TaxID=114398 RepID=UPI001C718C86|nr:uncharacterized protein LOC122271392 [Parasteatoda tepidariorum]
MGFRGNLPIFLKNFLMKRYFREKLGSTFSDLFVQAEGVPQGSVLSVILFITHVSLILNILPPDVFGSLYVDDLNVSSSDSDMRVIERQLQLAVNKISKWCEQNGHTLSPTKSSCIHFCRLRRLHNDPVISNHNVNIPIVSETKYLGVILDSKLTFLPHIRYLRKRCEKTLNVLRVLSNTFWGADRIALIRIYKALILSRIDYACAVYGTATASNLKLLDTVHHTAMRICSGAFRTSPVESLYSICNLSSLYFRRMQLCLTFYFRVMSSKSHPLRQEVIPLSLRRLYDARPSYTPPFNARMRTVIQTFNFCESPSQSTDHFLNKPWIIPSYHFYSPFASYKKSSISPSVYIQLFISHRHEYSQYVSVFTDGSKSPGHVGCGIIIADRTYSYIIPAICSVFTAEAVAILIALRLISSLTARKFCIYSDSQSVLRQLNNHVNNEAHPILCIIKHLLVSLHKSGFNILFCWIPSHVGISGNDMADSAARSAATPLTLSVPISDMKNYIRQFTMSLWQQHWDLQIENKLHTIKSTLEPWPVLQLRGADVKLTRLRIGHTRLTHLHLLFGEPPPRCDTCNVSLSIHHILIACPCFNQQRLIFFGSTILYIKDLLDKNHHPNIFAFLRAIGILSCI